MSADLLWVYLPRCCAWPSLTLPSPRGVFVHLTLSLLYRRFEGSLFIASCGSDNGPPELWECVCDFPLNALWGAVHKQRQLGCRPKRVRNCIGHPKWACAITRMSELDFTFVDGTSRFSSDPGCRFQSWVSLNSTEYIVKIVDISGYILSKCSVLHCHLE